MGACPALATAKIVIDEYRSRYPYDTALSGPVQEYGASPYKSGPKQANFHLEGPSVQISF